MDRLDYITYGLPLIIASVTGSGLGLYVYNVMGNDVFGLSVFFFFGILTVLLIFVFILPALSSYLEEYSESMKKKLEEDDG